jgi:hypothetical protein
MYVADHLNEHMLSDVLYFALGRRCSVEQDAVSHLSTTKS